MSTVMDTQDLIGSVRGVCLIAVLRRGGASGNVVDVKRVLTHEFREEVARFAVALAGFCGVDSAAVLATVDELAAASGEFLAPENINLQLGLLSGRPLPEYPFLTPEGVDMVALARSYLDVSRNLVHAAVRLRMQTQVNEGPEDFWTAATTLMSYAWGTAPAARSLAFANVVNAVSDVLFHNWDLDKRTTDATLLRRGRAVLEELRNFPIDALHRTP